MNETKELIEKGYAKINIGLDVVGKRDDGYHEVSMVMQDLELCDEVRIKVCTEGLSRQNLGVGVADGAGHGPQNINFYMDGATSQSLINDAAGDNLAVKAARLLFEKFDIKQDIDIHLTKNIPVAAGLAGGSTDAAAVLRGVNKLFDLGLSTQELMELGVKLGADVPYCVMGGTALSEGIGEVLTPIKAVKDYFVLLAKPEVGISTPEAYRQIDSLTDSEHPDIKGMVEAIESSDEDGMLSRMANLFEAVTLTARPEISELKKLMESNGALKSLMSGSGPTVFGFFEDEMALDKAYNAVLVSALAKDVVKTKVRRQ